MTLRVLEYSWTLIRSRATSLDNIFVWAKVRLESHGPSEPHGDAIKPKAPKPPKRGLGQPRNPTLISTTLHLKVHGTYYPIITVLITLLISGITPIRPFRGIISRVISTVIIG